jgi:hypothetical protein
MEMVDGPPGKLCAKMWRVVSNQTEAREMNTGQILLVIGAFVVLSTITLNVNATLVKTSTTGLEMEANLDALSIGQTMLDEILTKEFDEKTLNGVRAFSSLDVTPNYQFGPDGAGEVITGNGGVDTSMTGDFQSKYRFDDVDDYDSYTRKAWNPRFGWFTVSVKIEYVDEDFPDLVTDWNSFYKRITVTITQPNMVKDFNDTIVPLVMRDLAVYRRYF